MKHSFQYNQWVPTIYYILLIKSDKVFLNITFSEYNHEHIILRSVESMYNNNIHLIWIPATVVQRPFISQVDLNSTPTITIYKNT